MLADDVFDLFYMDTIFWGSRVLTRWAQAVIEARTRWTSKGIFMAHDMITKSLYKTIFPAAINGPVVVANAVNVAGVSCLIASGFQPKSFFQDLAHLAMLRLACLMLVGKANECTFPRPLHWQSNY